MRRTHVLRIPRSDDDDGSSFVLVHVTPSSSRNARPLDVKLVATEGEYPYVVSLQQSNVADLKASGGPCSAEEWEHILQSVLLGEEIQEDIQLTAAIRSDLEITVRKKVQRITQRLGSVLLRKTEDEEDSDVTEWCGIAVESRDELRRELASEKSKSHELEQAVSALKGQLDELTKAKREHETALLGKFCDLLNEKKAKIREQELVIRHARGNPALTGVASNRHKRKARSDPPSGDDDSDGGFRRMNVDPGAGVGGSGVGEVLSGDQETDGDEDDDQTTASEPDDEAAMERVKGNLTDNTNNKVADGRGKETPSSSPSHPAHPQRPGPTRSQALPERISTDASRARAGAGSETESDDDEL